MNFTLRSSSNPFNENERLTRKRQTTTTTTTTLNRFLSFNENKSSSVENRRRLLQVNLNLIFAPIYIDILFLVNTKFN
jgi:hypothetical protein